MDRDQLESDNRLYEGVSRLQQLLCRDNGSSLESDGCQTI